MNPYVRKASIEDIESIRSIAIKTWWPTYSEILSEEQIDFMLKEIYSADKLIVDIERLGTEYILLIENESEPVAFASYSDVQENLQVLKVNKLYCLPATQGKGYGALLLNYIAGDALAAGKKILDLNVNKYNVARGFYEKMGFEVIQEIDIPIGPYFMNDFVMRKHLSI